MNWFDFNRLKNMNMQTSDISDGFGYICIFKDYRIQIKKILFRREYLELADTTCYNSYRLVGYDLLIDNNLKVHLIEVNSKPQLSDAVLDKAVNRPMVSKSRYEKKFTICTIVSFKLYSCERCWKSLATICHQHWSNVKISSARLFNCRKEHMRIRWLTSQVCTEDDQVNQI